MKKSLLAISAIVALSSSAFGAGTAADTSITNKATLSYEVGGTEQTNIDSNEDTFKVDRKIDVTIAVNNSELDVSPKEQQAKLEYTVQNEGNDAETWTLSLAENTSDDFDVDTLSDCHLYDSSDNDLGVISDTSKIDISFTVDESKNFKVGCDIPDSIDDGKKAEIYLVATIKDRPDNKNDEDDQNVVQNVYAEDASDNNDAEYNGHFSKGGIYHIKRAVLSINKTSTVISDPVNNETNPKRIPGATVRYCFDIKNTGSADANKLRLHDDFTTEGKDKLDYIKSGIITQDIGTCDCKNIADTSGTNGASSTDIYIPEDANGITLGSNKQACGYIEAEIK